MLPEELIELARQVMEQKAETQTLEVKSAHQGCPKRLYDTLSSPKRITAALSFWDWMKNRILSRSVYMTCTTFNSRLLHNAKG